MPPSLGSVPAVALASDADSSVVLAGTASSRCTSTPLALVSSGALDPEASPVSCAEPAAAPLAEVDEDEVPYIDPGNGWVELANAAELPRICHAGMPGLRTPTPPDGDVRPVSFVGVVEPASVELAAVPFGADMLPTLEDDGVVGVTGLRAMSSDLSDLSSVWRSLSDCACDEACFSTSCRMLISLSHSSK